MANFKFESKEEKARLKERAEVIKPRNVPNLVATELGWSQPRPNGTLELLVSFRGLDELLGDVEPEIVDETPIEVAISEPVVEVQEDAPVEEIKDAEPAIEAPVEEVKVEETPAVVQKKPGRPAKKAAE